MQTDMSKPPQPPAPPASPQPASCENCGAPLYGKYCYACGQPAVGMVRHFSSIASDMADSVLNIDERVFKTLLPLYLRPGKLTLDYFAGKRARYVTPFRLVFFLAIVAFFAMQVTLKVADEQMPVVAVGSGPASSAPAPSASASTDADSHFSDGAIRFNDKVIWDQHGHTLHVDWLPAIANSWLNGLIDNGRANLHRLRSGNKAETMAESRRLIAGMLSVAPTVLFILLPFFALLLKVFYLFKHRLYMEHLIVAMHSHAFLMLSMLVLLALGVLRASIVPHAGWLGVPFGLLEAAAWIWVFVYLFVMQKRVYRQGKFMTFVKYACIGCCYTVLVTFGLMFAALASLTGA